MAAFKQGFSLLCTYAYIISYGEYITTHDYLTRALFTTEFQSHSDTNNAWRQNECAKLYVELSCIFLLYSCIYSHRFYVPSS